MSQLYLFQWDNSSCLKLVLFSRRALALSIDWLAKNVFMRGGNQAIGAPSGLSPLSAANRSVAALACRSRFFTLLSSFLDAPILPCRSAIVASMESRLRFKGPRKKLK